MPVAPPPEAVIPPEELDSIGAAARGYVERLKAGDVGSLPVILGMVVIVIFFTVQIERVLHRGQLQQPDRADVAAP